MSQILKEAFISIIFLAFCISQLIVGAERLTTMIGGWLLINGLVSTFALVISILERHQWMGETKLPYLIGFLGLFVLIFGGLALGTHEADISQESVAFLGYIIVVWLTDWPVAVEMANLLQDDESYREI